MRSDIELHESSGAHLHPAEVAGYVDHVLGEHERGRIEAHLEECKACRQEVREVSWALHSERPLRRGYVAAAAVAAAVVGILLFAPRLTDESSPAGPIYRGDEAAISEGTPVLQALSPAEDRPVHPDSVLFAWRSAGPDALYRITVTTEEGDVLWGGSTSDISLALPSDVGLRRGGRYFWYADALLPDGSSATTGIHGFYVGR